ncbi:MAG: response regulator transcription factor [Clostridiaceae bacterium]|nr:response regulator transcription factor [Clostridiaceae bacterium]
MEIKMIKIALCDDDNEQLDNITKYIDRFITEDNMHRNIEVESFSTGIELLNRIINDVTYDIIFLDIFMPMKNGVSVAKKIREKDNAVKIIFLTTSDEFAVASYGVHAFHYILKPVSYSDFELALQRVIVHTDNTDENYTIKAGGTVHYVPVHTIEFIEVIRKNCYYHLITGEIIISSEKLSDIEDFFLRRSEFFKPHRSYIINGNCISQSDNTIITSKTGAKIPIARATSKKFLTNYMNFKLRKRGEKFDK